MQADNSIAGSIAAIAAKAPAPPPKAAAASDGGMNLLDFGDDEVETPAPESSDPMALLDQLSEPAAPPKAAAGAADDDWADFTSTEPATTTGGAGTAGQGDWAPFTGATQPDTGDEWADFASAPGGAAPSATSADPFGMPSGPSTAAPVAPSGFSGAVPSTGGRQAFPLDAFAAPLVEPIHIESSSGVGEPPEASAPAAPVSAAVKNLAEKDPFADLFG